MLDSPGLYGVSPQSIAIDGIPCVPSVAALPEAPDLAVVAVPVPGWQRWPRSAGTAASGRWR